ncbi:hypothetical protein HDU76_001403 [Blyttiomyces sp. JEL0837]|nr:hypothetical protein HDU76_001403 [Blyttiomyces sp. JEL0837]
MSSKVIEYNNYKTVKIVLQPNGVAVLTLYRPDAQNSFNGPMVFDLIRAFETFDIDNRVRVVVVTGHGNWFCAGADLRQGDFSSDGMAKNDTETNKLINFQTHRDGGGLVTLAIHRCRKPIIAAINGPAVGVGATMTLGMDIRLAWKDAKIGQVYEKREEVLEAALAMAADIAENTSAVSAAMTKALIWRGGDSAEEAHLLDSKSIFWLGNGNDSKEGVLSFMQKRKAKFTDTVTEHMPPNYPWWKTVDTSVPKLSSKL